MTGIENTDGQAFSQILLPKQNPYCLVKSKQQEALISM